MTKNAIKNLETMIWEGQDTFEDFIQIASTLGYKYVISCHPLSSNLGAACKDDKELAEMLIEFSELGFSCKALRVDLLKQMQQN